MGSKKLVLAKKQAGVAKSRKQSRKKNTKRQTWETVFKILLLMIWVAAAVIVSQLIVGYAMFWMLGRETLSRTVPTAICSVLSYLLALTWLIFATPRLVAGFKNIDEQKKDNRRINKKIAPNGASREDLGLRDLPTWTDIGLAPVGFIAYALLAAGVTAIFNIFPWFDAKQTQNVGFNAFLAGPDLVIAFIILVVIAPIAEEIIFRGWLYGKVRQILSGKMSEALTITISIFLVSLLFGIVHMQWNVGVNVFALSIVLCGLREITGTIYASILTHMLKNGVAFFYLYMPLWFQ